MRVITLSTFVLIFCLSCISIRAVAASPATDKILILGDSLSTAYGIEHSQGWVQLLQNHLNNNGHRYQIVNASVSGETTRGGLSRLPTSLIQHHPKIVIIALGGNDGLRGISLKEFRNNLNTMILKAKATNAKVLLCGVRIPPNLGATYVSRFLQVYSETAQKHNIPLLKYILKDVSNKPHLMQDDGLHPTAEAQPIILNNVLSELNSII